MKNNFVEVCDTKYALKCAFESSQAQSVLKDYVKRQPEDINILGLLGKQLLLEEAQLCLFIKSKNNKLKVKLRVQISKFQVLASCWDAKTFFPKVRAIEEE